MIKIQISASSKAELEEVINALSPILSKSMKVKIKQDAEYYKAWIQPSKKKEASQYGKVTKSVV